MEQRLKERLTGAAVFIVAAFVFVPMLIDGARKPAVIAETNIPPKPATEFDSRLVPLPDPDEIVPPAPEPEPEEMVVADLPAATLAQGPAPQAAPPVAESPPPQATPPVMESPPPQATPPVAESPPPQAAAPVAESPAPQAAPPVAEAPAEAAPAPTKVVAGWAVQTGVFAARANAERMNAKLRDAGYPSYIEKIDRKGQALYRVRIGPEVLRSEAVKLRAAVREKLRLKDAMVVDYP